MAHIFNVIFSALQQRQSPYASVLGALLELAGERRRRSGRFRTRRWTIAWEEPVAFDGCSSKGQTKPGRPNPFIS
jgi:nitrate reductase delta subunit